MAKYETVVEGKFEEVVKQLQLDISNSGISMNLVDESNFTVGGTKVAVRVYDKYYMRNGNRTSLSLTVAGNEDKIYITAIGAGGGSGVIFNFSLGAETDMVDIVQRSVERMG